MIHVKGVNDEEAYVGKQMLIITEYIHLLKSYENHLDDLFLTKTNKMYAYIKA